MPDTLYEALTRDDIFTILGGDGSPFVGPQGPPGSVPFIYAKDFGAIGDGVNDDTAAIQAAIDYAIYDAPTNGQSRVMLGSGLFRTTDTIHLGYGDTTSTTILEGEGSTYRGQIPGGTTIKPDFHDRPAINVQGARGSAIRGIAGYGKLSGWILGLTEAQDTNPDNWDDPALGGATLDSRYAPYAFITIDAYSGPGTGGYANVGGSFAQQSWNRNHSSRVQIEDVHAFGFTVACAVKPSDSDANADFTTFRNFQAEFCKWGVSVGHTQSRNVAMDQCTGNRVYSWMTGKRHGVRNGKFAGVVTDLSVGGCIQLIDLGSSSIAGPLHFQNVYAEDLWRIGDITAQSGVERGVVFTTCQFLFDAQNEGRGYPATCLGGGNQIIDLKFNRCFFGNYHSVVPIDHFGAEYERCYFNPKDFSRVDTYEQFAHNALCGGLVTRNLARPRDSTFHNVGFDLDASETNPGSLNASTAVVVESERKFCIPIYARLAAPKIAGDDIHNVPGLVSTWAKSSINSVDLTDLTLTLGFTSLTDYEAAYFGMSPGDVLLDSETKSVFFIRSRSGNTVLAELQNNYRPDGIGGYTYFSTFSPTVGNLYAGNSQLYLPTDPARGDFTAASAVITNVQRGDGQSNFIEDTLVDDWMYVDDYTDRVVPSPDTKVAARSNSGKTITLSGNATYTQGRKRLSFFIRKPPANV